MYSMKMQLHMYQQMHNTAEWPSRLCLMCKKILNPFASRKDSKPYVHRKPNLIMKVETLIRIALETCILTFQVLSPGRRSNSGSSLETSRSSTESPHLRKIYGVMQNMMLQKCPNWETVQEEITKVIYEYNNNNKRSMSCWPSISWIVDLLCPEHYFSSWNQTMKVQIQKRRIFDQTIRTVKVTVKSMIIYIYIYLSNNSFIFNRVHWACWINHPPIHFEQTHTWTSNK